MNRKTFWGVLLAILLVVTQVTAVFAAPPSQTASSIIGTVQGITPAVDPNGHTIVVVALTDGSTVKLSVDNAAALGLVTKNSDGSVTVNDAMIGQTITIEPEMVLPDPCVLPDGANKKAPTALTKYFCGSLGLDYTTVFNLHGSGFGYGEIAQACFMAKALGGGSELCAAILQAKKSGDYSSITLPDGTTVKNWGQLKKVVLDHKGKNNLGSIVSGQGNGNGSGNSGGNGNGKGHDKEKNH